MGKLSLDVGRGPWVPVLGDIPASFSSLTLRVFLGGQIAPDSHLQFQAVASDSEVPVEAEKSQ